IRSAPPAIVASPPRVYMAHPVATYATPWARSSKAHLEELLPDCEVVDPEAQGWATDADWLRAWPALLDRLDALVVVAAPDGALGAGCVAELVDAMARGLPVAGLDLIDGHLRRVVGLTFEGRPSARRLATVSLAGLVVDPCRGAGTFGTAALTTGRRSIEADIDPATVAGARKRLAQVEADLREDTPMA
ncbi:MAG: hypothetical protein ACRD0J_12125, partial [Acidimicrobiales bacterium]